MTQPGQEPLPGLAIGLPAGRCGLDGHPGVGSEIVPLLTPFRAVSAGLPAPGLWRDGIPASQAGADLPGIAVGAFALEIAVLSEATFAHLAARKTIAEKFPPDSPQPQRETLTYLELLQFHWPLAASTLIFLAAQPLVSAALARGLQPEEDLAAWPILSGLFFLTRSPAVALPEVVIALYDEEGSEKSLFNFTCLIGVLLAACVVIIGFTPLASLYFETLIGVTPDLADIATSGVRFAIILPLVTALLSYLRGVLTARKKTLPITIAMIVELVTMASLLFGGVAFKIPGIPLAASTLSIAMGADALYLYFASRKTGNQLER